jgi:hypothetical protein
MKKRLANLASCEILLSQFLLIKQKRLTEKTDFLPSFSVNGNM